MASEDVTINTPIDAVSLQMPASYAGQQLPVSWRSRYGKKDASGNYVTTTFADLMNDPEVRIPVKKIGDSPNIFLAKLDKGFTMTMLSQIVTINATDANVKLLDWMDARAAEIAYRNTQPQ